MPSSAAPSFPGRFRFARVAATRRDPDRSADRRLIQSSLRAAAVLVSLAIVAAAAVADRSTGLSVTYFRDLDWRSHVSTGVDHVVGSDSVLQDAPFTPNVPFSAAWSGYLFVPRTGDYTFSIGSYGEVSLSIATGDGQTSASISPPGRTVHLDQGAHAIAILYRHPEGLYGLDVRMAPAGGPLERLSPASLSRRPYRPLTYRTIAALSGARTVLLVLWAAAGLAWIGKRVRPSVLLALVCTTAAFVLAIVYDWPEWIRGPGPYPPDWQWLRTGTVVLLGTAPILAVSAAIVAWMAFVARPSASRHTAALAILCAPLAAFAFQLSALHLQAGGAAATITRRTAGRWYDTFFRDAADMQTDVATFVSTYQSLRPSLSLHGFVHPPGPALYYRGIVLTMERHPGVAKRMLDACASFGVEPGRLTEPGNPSSRPMVAAALAGGLSVILLGALTAWPIAAIVAFATRNDRLAASAALLWTLCPAMAFFASEFNEVLTFLITTSGALALGALLGRGRIAAIACAVSSGIAAGLALFCSVGAAPMLAAMGLVVFVVAIRARVRAGRVARVLGLFAAGVAAVFAPPTLAGYNHIAVARSISSYQLNGFNPRRSQSLWWRFNLLDFSIFAGWPLLAWGAVAIVRSRGRSPLLWTLLAAVAALDLSGVSRGEVGRLWMPLTAPLCVAAVVSAGASGRAEDESPVVAALLAAATLCIEIFWLSYS